MIDSAAILLTLRARLESVAGLPDATQRAWENIAFTPTTGVPYLDEEYVPGGTSLLTTVQSGVLEATGLYVVTYYGLADTGATTIRSVADAILAAFPPGSFPALANGDVLRVRGDLAPFAGQITPDGQGRAVVQITIPWRVHTTNTAYAPA